MLSKDATFNNEKESRRTWPRSQVSLEKSSKTIAVEKMSQTKPHASVPLPHPPSQMASIFCGFSTW
jgi:hypothetical protein